MLQFLSDWLLLVAISVLDTKDSVISTGRPIFSRDYEGILIFFLTYAGTIIAAFLAIRKWVNEPVNRKIEVVEDRINLPKGTTVKEAIDGVGTKVGALEIEMGRAMVAYEKLESEVRNNQREILASLNRQDGLLNRLLERTDIMLDKRMQDIERVANELQRRRDP